MGGWEVDEESVVTTVEDQPEVVEVESGLVAVPSFDTGPF